MAEQRPKLNNPWFVAVWPGMGHVAINAGYYLLAKLGMRLLAEVSAHDLFDVEHVEVKGGLIRTGGLPRSRFFVWDDPKGKRDVVLFIGEAQPPLGKFAFCHRLVEYAQSLGVERMFTFAAMATQMKPGDRARVFGAATDEKSLDELKQLELELLDDGHIGGLNGVLLGAAAEHEMRGTCLLGEMPHLFVQLPFPAASQAVLEVFATMAGVEIDFTELAEQSKTMTQNLQALMKRIEQAVEQQQQGMPEEEESFTIEPPEQPRMDPKDEQRIEQLFEQAAKDRSKAYELKRELDRLEAFKQYEDRFLDLFKEQG